MSEKCYEKKVIVQYVENFMRKKSQYSMSKFYEKKSHTIVCRKFYEKKVIVQYVENLMKKKSQYSMLKIL